MTERRTPAKAQATAKRMRSARLVIVTGISGSGKSQAIRALEDLGYFCVDNLPVKLLPTLADLTLRPNSGITRAAVVIDIRLGAQLADFPRVYAKVRRVADLHPLLIFLEASEEALVRRYSETRRPHPLAPTSSPLEGLREERKRLGPIRKLADVRLDTTDMTVHELRQAFMNLSRGTTARRAPVVTLLSFGFKHGLPPDADLVFDVRFLPNPHFVPELRPRTGRDTRIARFLAQYPETTEFLERTTGLLQFLLPHYTDEGKSYVTVAIGCTGGRHRSVYVAETLKRRLADVPGVRLRVRHRDLGIE